MRHLTCLEVEDGACVAQELAGILAGCPGLSTLRIPNMSRVPNLCPVAATVRVLDISGRTRIDDGALATFTQVVEFNVCDNPFVTTVTPVASTLLILDASGSNCGIDDAGLADATQLVELNVSDNGNVTHVRPCQPSPW